KQLELGALTPTRDFNFISDTVNGFIAALEASDQISGETINLASRFEVSIGETVKVIAKLMGRDANIRQVEERLRPSKSEVERLCGENEKAKKLLGWRPQYADIGNFERGLKQTIDWFSEPRNLHLYKPDLYNI